MSPSIAHTKDQVCVYVCVHFVLYGMLVVLCKCMFLTLCMHMQVKTRVHEILARGHVFKDRPKSSSRYLCASPIKRPFSPMKRPFSPMKRGLDLGTLDEVCILLAWL